MRLLIKYLIVATLFILTLTTHSLATETLWRHPGFELTAYDINASRLNITNIWVLSFQQNGTPPLSSLTKAFLYYDSTSNKIKISENGGEYNNINYNATYNTNSTMDKNLSNFTNTPGFITNSTMDKNLSNFTNTPGFINNTNDSLVTKQMVDSCTAANDALGWNNSGFNCKTVGTTTLTTVNITSDQTWTVPAGTIVIWVSLWAAGGGGGGASDQTPDNSGGSGGSGEAIDRVQIYTSPGMQYFFKIGLGGAGGVGAAGVNGSWSYMNNTANTTTYLKVKGGERGYGGDGLSWKGGIGGGYTGGASNNSANYYSLSTGGVNKTYPYLIGGSGGGDAGAYVRCGGEFGNYTPGREDYLPAPFSTFPSHPKFAANCSGTQDIMGGGAAGYNGTSGGVGRNMNGINAPDNSGAGGGGTYTQTAVVRTGGAGGSGGARIEY